jgi:hypothetical protein
VVAATVVLVVDVVAATVVVVEVDDVVVVGRRLSGLARLGPVVLEVAGIQPPMSRQIASPAAVVPRRMTSVWFTTP